MRTQFNIATLADHPQAAPILARWCYDEWGRDDGLSLEDEINRFERALRADTLPLVLIARDKSNVIACAQLKTAEMPQFPELTYWLGGVYVAAPFRGQGVGRLLIEAVEQQARQSGIATLHLQTEALTGGLYAALGWQPMFNTINHGVEVLVMRRELAQAELSA